jgi:hypothetical protein
MTNHIVCLTRVVVLSLTFAGLSSTTAEAQSAEPRMPRADIFAGAAFWQEEGLTFTGLQLAGAIRASRHVGFVGDLAFYDPGSVLFFPPRSTVRTLMGGVRVYIPLQRVTLFGQVLAGSAPLDDFAMQPGAGLDVPLNRHVAIRVAGDVKVAGDDGSTYVGGRISTGVVFLLGGQ